MISVPLIVKFTESVQRYIPSMMLAKSKKSLRENVRGIMRGTQSKEACSHEPKPAN